MTPEQHSTGKILALCSFPFRSAELRLRIKSCLLGAGATALLFGLAACGSGEAPEKKPATGGLETFKSEMTAVTDFYDSKKDNGRGNPSIGFMGEIASRMNSVNAEGLPTDLTEAFASLRQEYTAVAALLEGIPTTNEAAMDAWINAKGESFSKTLGEAFGKLEKQQKRMKETAATYQVKVPG